MKPRVGISLLSLTIIISIANTVSAAAAPNAPQYVEAMAGVTQVAVTWDPPSGAGTETINYTARVWTVPPPTTSPVFASCSTTGLGCTISGLTTGTTYYVDVVAANSGGTSAPSAMKPVSLGNAGSPPSNVSARGDSSGRIAVTWTPPTNLGTGQFAWYRAEAFSSSEVSAGASVAYCTEDPASATGCTISGLKLGSTYYIQVRTITSLGSSYPSAPRVKVFLESAASPSPKPSASPPASQPVVQLTAPQSVKVVTSSKTIKVTWKAPKTTGGKKVVYYRAGIYTKSGVLLSFCKTKSTVLSCTLIKPKTNVTVYIGVVALYAGAESQRSALIAVVPKA